MKIKSLYVPSAAISKIKQCVWGATLAFAATVGIAATKQPNEVLMNAEFLIGHMPE
jgi:hypothetical protein